MKPRKAYIRLDLDKCDNCPFLRFINGCGDFVCEQKDNREICNITDLRMEGSILIPEWCSFTEKDKCM